MGHSENKNWKETEGAKAGAPLVCTEASPGSAPLHLLRARQGLPQRLPGPRAAADGLGKDCAETQGPWEGLRQAPPAPTCEDGGRTRRPGHPYRAAGDRRAGRKRRPKVVARSATTSGRSLTSERPGAAGQPHGEVQTPEPEPQPQERSAAPAAPVSAWLPPAGDAGPRWRRSCWHRGGGRRRRRLQEGLTKPHGAPLPTYSAGGSPWRRTSSNQPRSVPAGTPPGEGRGLGGGQPRPARSWWGAGGPTSAEPSAARPTRGPRPRPRAPPSPPCGCPPAWNWSAHAHDAAGPGPRPLNGGDCPCTAVLPPDLQCLVPESGKGKSRAEHRCAGHVGPAGPTLDPAAARRSSARDLEVTRCRSAPTSEEAEAREGRGVPGVASTLGAGLAAAPTPPRWKPRLCNIQCPVTR
ncbi:uncharacterized protein LOC104675200 [Rhinopithecus roxellana]|uniref:uncharacterized protein LOC104675200 n=1 Tax=Rhinopithecus roxellana TaxID=61622 RepID=UPI0012374B2B|nr:uncharacterized protein LOC104675200 [Rhinopithecus roxellana]